MISLKDRLKEILLTNKLLTQEQLDQALIVQKEKGGRLSDIVVELKFVKEGDLALALSEGLGFPLIDLKRFKTDYEVAKIIPLQVARNYQIIALSKMGEAITLAMADPLNIFAIDHVQALTGYRINPIIASSPDIMQAIELSYPDVTKGMIENLVKEISGPSLELLKQDAGAEPPEQELNRISQSSPAIKITNMLLEDAVKKKASDVLIEPWENKLRVRFRVDGILQEIEAPPKNMHAPIVSRIKVMSALNIAEHRLPQDSRFKSEIGSRTVDFRVSVLPSSFGEKVALRILDKNQANLDLEKLGFSPGSVDRLKKTSSLPHGMILVTGPTGSGKTTTLYSILKYADSPEKNIVTVEDPVEYQLEGINQVTIRSDIGLTFAAALRSILRQDPNVIMVGEIRDYETADIAVKSALTGHLVLSTLHTTTACGSIVRLLNMGIEPYLINSSLVCVAAQRLVRKVCNYCKEEYAIKKELLGKIGLFPEIKKPLFYRGRGCRSCFNLGYSGRVGIAEVLMVSPAVRELIISRPQEHAIKQKASEEGMRTLREEGMALALGGVTTIEEVLRVTARDE